MRRKLFGLVIVLAAVMGTCALLTGTPAAASSCPPRTHLFVCNGYSFCCPNGAFCICRE
jgi:hypothetical protein